MPRMRGSGLSRREREILEVLFRLGRASAADVQEAIPHAPSYSAVRTLLKILEDKGLVRHEAEGKRYLYRATQPRDAAASSALRQVLATFFGGSLASAAQSLLSDADAALPDEELDRLARLIDEARRHETGEEGRS
jgi:BlaI family penicillinase repressor